MPVVNWVGTPTKQMRFSDLPLNASFKNVNGYGAIYRKVCLESNYCPNKYYYMLEEATGKLFNPTNSPVVLVHVEVTIDEKKPALAGY